MRIVTIVISIFLSIFSTAVMSYISMATPIGPWIAPTLALIAIFFFRTLCARTSSNHDIIMVTAAGSIGGILATALGFSFPTLYFLNPSLFNTWMASPIYFCAVMSGLSLGAGLFGIWIAHLLEYQFLERDKLAFPVGQLVYKMIAVQEHAARARDLSVGFCSTLVFCFLQTSKRVIPKSITLVRSFEWSVLAIPTIQIALWPMLWAIGFIAGPTVVTPLVVGVLSRIGVMSPIQDCFFCHCSNAEFVLAFCSGMVLSGALASLMQMPRALYVVGKMIHAKHAHNRPFSTPSYIEYVKNSRIQFFLALACAVCLLTYFSFSWLAQVYLLICSAICAYQISYIAGQIGLAQLGRFATFVMVPALVLFSFDMVQIVFIATFVEISGGVCADVLCGLKLAQLAGIQSRRIYHYQYLGLITSSLVVGVVFWLLIRQCGLGSPELFAQRAQARQLLINVRCFDYYVLCVGFVYGYILKYIKMNPMLVLGGLLMPIDISLGLIVGGVSAELVAKKERWYPFWSGVFAASSIWMIVRALFF